MRIVAGKMGGRVLRAPAGMATRPTSDRVRQAIFNVLGPVPDQCRVLDLFAGSGAMGFEALSRGAAHVTFVDSARSAIQVLRENLAMLKVSMEDYQILPVDAISALAGPAQGPWHWIFVDPPYRTDLASACCRALTAGHVGSSTVVVVEHDRRNSPSDVLGPLTRTDLRRYGDTEVSYYRTTEPSS
jgi:16S rRNA (guanine966-N2)-methyltransferase